MTVDYSKSKIYTIRSKNHTNLIYVGSTTQKLSKRWGEHKAKSRIFPLRLLYKTINSQWDSWYIELYQLYPCKSSEELQQKEGEVIRLIGNLNMTRAHNVSNNILDCIDEKMKEINVKQLEKQREYTRKSRAKHDPDELRRTGTEKQRKYRARVKLQNSVNNSENRLQVQVQVSSVTVTTEIRQRRHSC